MVAPTHKDLLARARVSHEAFGRAQRRPSARPGSGSGHSRRGDPRTGRWNRRASGRRPARSGRPRRARSGAAASEAERNPPPRRTTSARVRPATVIADAGADGLAVGELADQPQARRRWTLPSLVDQDAQRAVDGGHHQVEVAVAVEVARRRRPGPSGALLEIRAPFARRVLESARPRFRSKRGGWCIGGVRATWGRRGRSPGTGRASRRRRSRRGPAPSRRTRRVIWPIRERIRDVLEGQAVEVAAEPGPFLAEVGVDQVEPAVAVEVGDLDPHAPFGRPGALTATPASRRLLAEPPPPRPCQNCVGLASLVT